MTENRARQWYFLPVVPAIHRPLVSKRSRWRSVAMWAVVVLAGLAYWWWPGLVGAGEPSLQPAVIIIGDGEMLRAKTVISRRLVEEGFTVAVIEVEDSWCEVSDLIESSRLEANKGVIVALDPGAVVSCGPTEENSDAATLAENIARSLQSLTNGQLIVMSGLTPGADEMFEQLQNVGLTGVDVSGILAAVDERVDCLWWDDCVPDVNGVGYVVLRDDQGLTMAGQQRIARRIVAQVQS